MINKVILVGNVGQDPEIRYTGDAVSGAKVATIRLATSERYKDRNGNLQEHTEWHTVVVWRNTADVVEKYVRKGSQLYIEGKIRTSSWDDQNGNKRYTTEIMADTLQLLGKRTDNPAGGQGGYSAPAQQGYSQPAQTPGYAQQPVQQPVQHAAPSPAAAAQANLVSEDPGDDLPF